MTPNRPIAPEATGSLALEQGGRREQRLQSARRIDWRYLLENPRPERVALVGNASSGLRSSLRDAFPQLVEAGSPSELCSASIDLIVLAGTTVEVVPAAGEALRSGGDLYWELPPGLPQTDARAALAQASLQDISGYWHRPGFDTAWELIPWEDPGVLHHVLRGGAHGWGGEARRAAARWLRRFGLLERIARSRSILARRPGDSSPAIGPARRLRDLFREISGTERSSLLARTPRFRASGHTLLFAFAERETEPRLVAKIARLPEDDTLTREATSLKTLADSGVSGVPRLVAHECPAGIPTLIESVVPGRPIHPARFRRAMDEHVRLTVDWLVRLHTATRRRAPDPDAWNANVIDIPLDALRIAFGDEAPEQDLVRRTRELTEPLRAADVPWVFEHGDFGAPNLLRDETGALGVVDWELGQADGLVSADVFGLLAFAAVSRDRAHDAAGFEAAFRTAFLSPDSWALPWVREIGRSLALDPDLLAPLLVLSAARSVASYADRLTPGADAEAQKSFGRWIREERSFTWWRESIQAFDRLRFDGRADE